MIELKGFGFNKGLFDRVCIGSNQFDRFGLSSQYVREKGSFVTWNKYKAIKIIRQILCHSFWCVLIKIIPVVVTLFVALYVLVPEKYKNIVTLPLFALRMFI